MQPSGRIWAAGVHAGLPHRTQQFWDNASWNHGFLRVKIRSITLLHKEGYVRLYHFSQTSNS